MKLRYGGGGSFWAVNHCFGFLPDPVQTFENVLIRIPILIYLHKFSAKFLLENVLVEMCSKKYIHEPKS
jgi:hypothetical protein